MNFGKPSFYYWLISDALVLHLASLIAKGRSLVLLGPRGVGKRFVLAMLELHWSHERRSFVKASFGPGQEVPDTGKPAAELVVHESEVSEILGNTFHMPGVCRSIEQWESWLRSKWQKDGAVPILFLVTNVDGMARELAQYFLSRLRELAQDRVLTVLATGESNLVDLVHGPTSEFNCADQFMLQAHDEAQFFKFLSNRLKVMNFQLPVDQSEASNIIRLLYELTGGDVLLLRIALICISERRVHEISVPVDGHYEIKIKDVPRDLLNTYMVPVAGFVPFRYAVRCIESDPRSWGPLQALLSGVQIFAPGNEPTTLELAGLARREGGDNALRWASIYAQRFAQSYFTPTRLGDYFATAGCWEDAFACYQQAKLGCARPLNDDDNLWLGRSINALLAEFDRIASDHDASDGDDRLAKRMEQAITLLLSTSQPSIWRWRNGGWCCVANPDAALPRSFVMPDKHSRSGGWEHFTADGEVVVVCMERCPDGESLPDTLVLLRSPQGGAMTPGHRDALSRLLSGYRQAREHLLHFRALRRDWEKRRRLIAVTGQIFSHIGEGKWSIDEILRFAGHELCQNQRLGLLRVAFFLITADERQKPCLQLAYDRDAISVLPGPFLPLESGAGVLGEVFHRGQKKVLSATEARTMLADYLAVPAVHPTILLPMDGQGVWVVSVAEESILGHNMQQALEICAQRLGSALQLATKVGMLRSSLNSMPNPVIIIDGGHRVRMFNQGAKDRLDILSDEPPGWASDPRTLRVLGCDRRTEHEIERLLAPNRESSLLTDIARMNGQWMADVFPLKGWNDQPEGWFVHLKNRAFLFETVEIMRRMALASRMENAFQLLTEGIEKFGYGRIQARLYVIDPLDETQLRAKACYGMEAGPEAHFLSGACALHRHKDKQGWLAIEKKILRVFRWMPEEVTEPQLKRTTEGLIYRAVPTTAFEKEFEKHPLDFWIDIPLFTTSDTLDGDKQLSLEKLLGKLTLVFRSEDGERLPVEIIEHLRAMSFMVSNLIQRLNLEETRLRTLRETADTSVRMTGHFLNSKLKGLEQLQERLRDLERGVPTLKALNDEFKAALVRARSSIRRIGDNGSVIKLEPSFCDLRPILDESLSVLRRRGIRARWDGDPPDLIGWWDHKHMSDVVDELMDNATRFGRPAVPLEIVLSAQRIPKDSGGERVRLVLQDNGRGVPAENKPKLFDLGFTTEVSRHGEPPHGCGLAYVKRVINAMTGTIEETGPPGSGAVFEIEFLFPNQPPPTPENMTA